MKVAIDTRWIFREISGIGAYTRDLVRSLREIDGQNQYLLLFNDAALRERTLAETGAGAAHNVDSRLIPYGVFAPMSQLKLPRLLRHEGVDVYHSTNYMIPLLAFPSRKPGAVKCATTIHDVIPMIFPKHAPRSRKARIYPLYRRLMVQVGKRSDVIVTDSEASRGDIIRHLRIPPARHGMVRSIPCGVGERFEPPPQRPPRPADAERSVLYVGRADPYKNVTTLIRAFALARESCPFPLRLILAGSPDPRYPEAGALAAELGLGDCLTWTGYLSDDALVATYQQADLLVHPSRYEGFGLQVAEAMACDVPVICSTAGSLPEVAGDAAILVPPDDVDGFREQIVRVLTDPTLSDALRAKGRAQAAHFTWRRTATEMLAVYKKLAGEP